MSNIHIANTNFEWELTQHKPIACEKAIASHPIFLQLQFLPFLYGRDGDGVALTVKPPDSYLEVLRGLSINPLTPFFIHETRLPFDQLETWGASQDLTTWAKQRFLLYPIPLFCCVQKVNSKAFSFSHTPKLPNAELLHNEKEANIWLSQTAGKRVLKTVFGVSARGHFFIDEKTSEEKIFQFLRKQWANGYPVIAEPWMKRILDFSTQWIISKQKQFLFLGATLCENDGLGAYRKNIVGDLPLLFEKFHNFYKEHLQIAEKILQKIAEEGFFGNIGFDAMIYESESKEALLHPIVEINARKTMGWVALELQKHYYLNKTVSIAYIDSAASSLPSLLPTELINLNGKKITFSKKLVIEIILDTKKLA